MTQEEWENKTSDWKKGWKACQEAQDIPDEKSEEWIEGYKYAIDHPFGPCAVPQ